MLTSECICTHLRRAARGVSRHYDEALEGFGINVAQFSLLRHLRRLDQPSISTLAEAMGLDRSTLGRNLRVLEAEGLVALAEGQDQRRAEENPTTGSPYRCHFCCLQSAARLMRVYTRL